MSCGATRSQVQASFYDQKIFVWFEKCFSVASLQDVLSDITVVMQVSLIFQIVSSFLQFVSSLSPLDYHF